MKIEIKSRYNSSVLFAVEARNMKLAVELAVKQGTSLKGADLYQANLEGTSLEDIKQDFFKVLSAAPGEVAGLRRAMTDGKIDGSTYSGECACLVGTIAKVKGCDYTDLRSITADMTRPAERWFLMFSPGHTPKNHAGMKITLGWIDEWAANKGRVPK